MYNFTIIIPHYNIPSLLERCLMSIPKRSDVQVIVVDDCSDNKSVSALKILETKFDSVMFIYRKENNGGGKCRNEGLKYAKGKWLLFADSDDFFSQNFSFLLDKHTDDDSDIVYFRVGCVESCDITKISEKRDYNKNRIDYYQKKNDENVLRFLHSEPWGKLIKRDLVERYSISFSETIVCNDYYFSALTGFHAAKITADNTILYYLTVREGSVSCKTETCEKIITRINVATSVESYLLKHNYRLEDRYKAEKIDMRMITLLKKDMFLGIKQFFEIKKMGLSVLPIMGKMLKTFFANLKGEIK